MTQAARGADDLHPREQGLKPELLVPLARVVQEADDLHPREQGLKLSEELVNVLTTGLPMTFIHENKD